MGFAHKTSVALRSDCTYALTDLEITLSAYDKGYQLQDECLDKHSKQKDRKHVKHGKHGLEEKNHMFNYI